MDMKQQATHISSDYATLFIFRMIDVFLVTEF